jgi:hypothetical protein
VSLSCPILTKVEMCRKIFVRTINVKFHKRPSGGNAPLLYGRKDGRT